MYDQTRLDQEIQIRTNLSQSLTSKFQKKIEKLDSHFNDQGALQNFEVKTRCYGSFKETEVTHGVFYIQNHHVGSILFPQD